MFARFFAFCFAVLFLVGCSGAGRFAAVAHESISAPGLSQCQGGTRWAVLLDLSGSISDAQRRSWGSMVTDEIAPRLKACDQVLVLAVHEASGSAAPLLTASIPDSGESIQKKLAALRALKDVRAKLVATVASAARGQGGASRTDILGALERVSASSQATRVVLCSDMLHVGERGELNLEAAAVKGRIDAVVKNVVGQRGWTSERFKNAKVVAVLPAMRGVQSGPNSRQTLREFWAALFAATGAELVSFETYIPKGIM